MELTDVVSVASRLVFPFNDSNKSDNPSVEPSFSSTVLLILSMIDVAPPPDSPESKDWPRIL